MRSCQQGQTERQQLCPGSALTVFISGSSEDLVADLDSVPGFNALSLLGLDAMDFGFCLNVLVRDWDVADARSSLLKHTLMRS